jgi:DNA modification methylase
VRTRTRPPSLDSAHEARARAHTHEGTEHLAANWQKKVELRWQPSDALLSQKRNARTHSPKQVAQIAASIRRFGFTNPILVDEDNRIIAGHGRLLAAKELGLLEVPTLSLSYLTTAEKRSYVIADNRLAELAGWDNEILAIELKELSALELDFDVAITGFETAEIDLLIENGGEKPAKSDPDDWHPDIDPARVRVTRPGDLWQIGSHRLLCADAREESAWDRLLGNECAQMVFSDPPYNVRIDGHVCGLGAVKHREFAMAVGEMNEEAFVAFLQSSTGRMRDKCDDGAVLYLCMDWRHIHELLTAAKALDLTLLNICLWNKTNGGMGSLYRSKHELIVVVKTGTAPHRNNIELGKHGRYRTNVWDYAGVNAFGVTRDEALALHPTVKPTALVADAIKDVTARGDLVLDGFAGSGTTLLAAHRTGRRCYALELDPLYVDVTLQRLQRATGIEPVEQSSGLTFSEVRQHRMVEAEASNPSSSLSKISNTDEGYHD